MEFKFNVNRILPKKINKITHTLIPEGFEGNRRELNECQRQLTKIIDDMGEASARAQGLNKPVTSAQKLRDTDHIVYLLIDERANNDEGVVVGLLKTGSKNLFIFDKAGVHYQLKPRCVLDFYVHESRQRTGLGNILYEHMLIEEDVKPTKLAIDRPSEKLLAFLRKYYGLSSIIPQNNKFVVFEEFFDDELSTTRDSGQISAPNNSGNNKLPALDNRDHVVANRSFSINGSDSRATASSSPYGRYAATRPPCSMADIIHNTTVIGQSVERTGNGDEGNGDNNGVGNKLMTTGWMHVERPRSLSLYSQEQQSQRTSELPVAPTPIVPDQHHQQQQPSFASLPREIVKEREEVDAIDSCARLVAATPSIGVKSSSPSCAQQQQVITVKNAGHMDLKFYHSPLW